MWKMQLILGLLHCLFLQSSAFLAYSGCSGGSRDPHLSLKSLHRAAAPLLTIIHCYTVWSFSCTVSYFGSVSKHIRTYRYIQKNESFHYELGTQIFFKILYGRLCNCQSNIAPILACCCQNFFPLALESLFLNILLLLALYTYLLDCIYVSVNLNYCTRIEHNK